MSVDPDLARLLKRLKLGPLLPTLPERLTLARAQQLDYAAFLTLLLADEVQRRDQQALERRLTAAGFEDLHDAAHDNGDQPPRDVEPATPEEPVEPVPAAVGNVAVAPDGGDSAGGEPAPEPPQPAVPVKPISPTPIGIERPDLPERDIDPEVRRRHEELAAMHADRAASISTGTPTFS